MSLMDRCSHANRSESLPGEDHPLDDVLRNLQTRQRGIHVVPRSRVLNLRFGERRLKPGLQHDILDLNCLLEVCLQVFE